MYANDIQCIAQSKCEYPQCQILIAIVLAAFGHLYTIYIYPITPTQ